MGAYQHVAQKRAEDFQRSEEERKSARDSYIGLQQNVLNNPNNSLSDPALNDIKDPVAKANEIARRKAIQEEAIGNITKAHAPHEGGSLIRAIAGAFHGAPPPQNNATTVANTPPPDPNAAPPQPPPIDVYGIPISDPNVAAAHAEPMNPMADGHAIISRGHEALNALGEFLGNHAKGAAAGLHAKPAIYETPEGSANVAAGYQSPITTARETADLVAQHQQDIAGTKGEYALEAKRIGLGGTSALARYQRAWATDHGKEFKDLNADELAQSTREFHEANSKPQVIIDPTTGIANIITRDDDGRATTYPMRDQDGHTFGGFKPDKVTIHNGHYQFIGADGQVHSVPITNVTRTIFGPHVVGDNGEKPLTLHKRDGEATAPVIAPGPPAPPADVAAAAGQIPAQAAPPAGNGAQRRGAAVKNPTPSSAGTTQAAPNGYAGKILGPAKLNTADRSVLESDQQLTDSVGQVLPLLEKMKDKNSLIDRGKMELAWQQYKHGMSPSDPELGEVIRNVALLQIQGAAPWTRIGRSKYTFDVIQKHLPAPTDTPKLLYDKVKWLKDNVIPSSVNATLSPAGVGGAKPAAPVSSAAPSNPPPSGGMINVRLANGKVGPIHPSQLQRFLADNPGAQQVP